MFGIFNTRHKAANIKHSGWSKNLFQNQILVITPSIMQLNPIVQEFGSLFSFFSLAMYQCHFLPLCDEN